MTATLCTKSQDSITVSESCFSASQFHIAGSRAYYAIYQKLKSYLISLDPNNEKYFDHTGLRRTAIANIKNHFGGKISKQQMNLFYKLQQLYNVRAAADYETEDITPTVARQSIDDAKSMIELLRMNWCSRNNHG